MVMVSIITPSYNSESSIIGSIVSVQSQEYDDYEHIIVDDCSSDRSVELVKKISETDGRIKLIQLYENLGAANARNIATRVAQGRYIVFLDSDDVWQPEKLKSQIDFMEKERVVFSYGDYKKVNISSGETFSCCVAPPSLSYKELLIGCPIGCLTAAYNQEVLGKKYMPLVRRGQDWGLWLAITRGGVIAKKYPGNYASYNVGDGSLSRNKFKKIFDIYKIYRQEEGVSVSLSFYYIFLHVLYVWEKQKSMGVRNERK